MKKETDIKFLFDGKYAPLTDWFAFIDAPMTAVITAYEQWIANQMEPIPEKKTAYTGSFENLLKEGLPYRYPSKVIFFETKSKWIGFWRNTWNTNFDPAVVIAERINVPHVIGAGAIPSSYKKVINGWGGGVFILYDENGNSIRSIELSDQDRWTFDSYGEPLPFEDVEKYKEKFARNRFTPEMLDKYLKEFGIDFFNEDFYMPPGSTAYIMEQIRPPFNEDDKPISLEEMRKRYMYE